MRGSPFAIPLAIALSACGSSSGPKHAAASATTTSAVPALYTTTQPAGPTPFAVLQAEVKKWEARPLPKLKKATER